MVEIYDEDAYREKLRKHYNSMINGRFMSLQPYSLSDEDLMKVIPDGFSSDDPLDIDNFCSWLTIGESVDTEYLGKPYTFVNFYSNACREKPVLQVNYSQFQFYMSPSDGTLMPAFCSQQAQYVSTVDGKVIAPVLFFTQDMIGSKILYICGIPCVTSFGSQKSCVFFAKDKTSPDDLRKYIKDIQISILSYYLQNPTSNIPTTIIKFYGTFQHNVRNHLTIAVAKQIFEDEFLSLFQQKKQELLRNV